MFFIFHFSCFDHCSPWSVPLLLFRTHLISRCCPFFLSSPAYWWYSFSLHWALRQSLCLSDTILLAGMLKFTAQPHSIPELIPTAGTWTRFEHPLSAYNLFSDWLLRTSMITKLRCLQKRWWQFESNYLWPILVHRKLWSDTQTATRCCIALGARN